MPPTEPRQSYVTEGRLWPVDLPSMREERRRRWEAFLGLRYRLSELKALGLFQGTDQSGAIIHEARRIMRDCAFVVEVDAAVLSQPLAFNATADSGTRLAGGDLEAGVFVDEAVGVWRDSRGDETLQAFALRLCAIGDALIELVETDGGVRLVQHNAEHVDVYYDRFGTDLEAVRISFDYYGPPDPDSTSSEKHTYERWLYRDRTMTRIDSGTWDVRPHALGVVPAVHVQFAPSHDPRMGRHASYGMEDAEATVNSAATQLIVAGTRAADPWLKVVGARIAGGLDVSAEGKTLALPEGADAAWLEATLQGMTALVDNMRSVREGLVQTCPEFLFVDAGASASGTALSYRASAFKLKIEPVYRRFTRAIGRLLGMAVAMKRGEAWGATAHDIVEVRGGPAIPEDRAAFADLIDKLVSGGFLREVDAQKALQGAGLTPSDADPAEYADLARTEAQARDAHAVGVLNSAAGMGGANVAIHENMTAPA